MQRREGGEREGRREEAMPLKPDSHQSLFKNEGGGGIP